MRHIFSGMGLTCQPAKIVNCFQNAAIFVSVSCVGSFEANPFGSTEQLQTNSNFCHISLNL
jgi:hypothetical protein